MKCYDQSPCRLDYADLWYCAVLVRTGEKRANYQRWQMKTAIWMGLYPSCGAVPNLPVRHPPSRQHASWAMTFAGVRHLILLMSIPTITLPLAPLLSLDVIGGRLAIGKRCVNRCGFCLFVAGDVGTCSDDASAAQRPAYTYVIYRDIGHRLAGLRMSHERKGPADLGETLC
jgi:hypothetical protein